MPKYIGYVENLPVKQGDSLTVKKGTIIHSLHPSDDGEFPSKTNRKIVVDHVINGWNATSTHRDDQGGNAQVVWAGKGGYWFWVDINDVAE